MSLKYDNVILGLGSNRPDASNAILIWKVNSKEQSMHTNEFYAHVIPYCILYYILNYESTICLQILNVSYNLCMTYNYNGHTSYHIYIYFCAVNKCFKKIIFYYYNYQFLNEFHFGF